VMLPEAVLQLLSHYCRKKRNLSYNKL